MENREVVRRGDGFDIGEESIQPIVTGKEGPNRAIDIVQNPGQLSNMLGLTQKQEANVRSLIVGAGTGGIHRLLSQQLGGTIAGALGGLISGYLADKMFEDKK